MTQSRAETVRLPRPWIAVAGWLAFQLLLTSLPGDMLPTVHTTLRIDWVAHLCLYGMLGLLLVRATLMDTLMSSGPRQCA